MYIGTVFATIFHKLPPRGGFGVYPLCHGKSAGVENFHVLPEFILLMQIFLKRDSVRFLQRSAN
jgi:hypothetical protein